MPSGVIVSTPFGRVARGVERPGDGSRISDGAMKIEV
jgi:hypothetical protein